jgi:hypothetical protein
MTPDVPGSPTSGDERTHVINMVWHFTNIQFLILLQIPSNMRKQRLVWRGNEECPFITFMHISRWNL